MNTPLSVLLIEDSENDALLLLNEFEQAGFETSSRRVQSAPELRAALDERSWDVVISDHSLPRFNSFAALEIIRARGLELPFLIVSGTIGDEDAVRAMKAGAQDYILKDNLKRLVPAVRRELKEARIRLEKNQVQMELDRLISRQKLLATAVEQAAEAISIAGSDGNLQYTNPAFVNMSGYTVEEVLGRKLCFPWGEENISLFENEVWPALVRGEAWTGHIKKRKKDGSLYHSNTTISPVQDDAGRIVNYVSVCRDITRELDLRNQLSQAQKMEAIGALAGGVAHDFNNLLTIVLGYAELLLMNKDLGEEVRSDLEKIAQAAQNGGELVQRLMMFSRKAEIKARPINLNQQIEKLQKLLSRTIPKMIEIRLHLAEDLAVVNADPTQMEQVLMNLAVNSKHAMPDGGRLAIETRNILLDEEYCRLHVEARPGEYVLLAVSDTGHGMDDKTMQRIFEPFFTTKGPGEGTGLGLAMVYAIIKQHQGHIRCYSTPGQGTTFKIYLPVFQGQGREVKASRKKSLPRGGRETILLVDDEPAILDMGVRILGSAGYKVILASTGEEALEAFQKARGEVALIVLDLIMPGMGGRRCLKKIRRLDDRVKIVISSGHTEFGLERNTLPEGADGFISKPFTMSELLRPVREVLDRKRD
ncbi:MAG: response regulator [Thermodesulfobacteriota bacterium]